MRISHLATATAAFVCLLVGDARALTIFLGSASAPQLSGSTSYDFDDQADDTFFTSTTVMGGELTITANNGQLWFDDQFASQFGTTGIALDTNYNTPNDFDFVFTTAVSAFGFAINALDVDWTMEVYDASDSLLASFTIPNQVALGGFARRGFAGAWSDVPIQRVHVFAPVGSDRALIDDFQVVPEPSAFALMLAGLVGLALAGTPPERRRRASAPALAPRPTR
ncbi:MAG: hypothetical protein R3E88_14175 [Myxococcota bacterium]